MWDKWKGGGLMGLESRWQFGYSGISLRALLPLHSLDSRALEYYAFTIVRIRIIQSNSIMHF